MNNEWNVQAFLNQLRSAQPQPKSNEPRTQLIETTYLNIPANLGRYQIFPINSVVTNNPFEFLYRTKEVSIATGNKNQDGTDRYSWHKLLPLCAYDFYDENTNRIVSSLTQSEADLLQSAHGVFDRMWEVIPEDQRKEYCRVKNYTVGFAYVINKFGLKDQTKPIKSGFSTLLVCTSKDFANALNKDIDLQQINHGDPMNPENRKWLGEIYNRKSSGRTGWLIFTITGAPNGIGFSVSASHTSGLAPSVTDNIVIPEDQLELMKDPIRTFLGWQAGQEKLFNEQLIIKTIEKMNTIIAKFSNSAVYANTSQAAMATEHLATPNPAAPVTNDPMLASMAQPAQMNTLSKDQIAQANTDPFVTPPAAQFDPMAGVPNNYGQFQQVAQPAQAQGYQQPQFAGTAYTQPQFAQGVNPFDGAQPNPYLQQQ